MSMNKIFTIGRQTADPQLAERGGAPCCTFTIASDSYEKDADGKYVPIFYRATVWRKLGELCASKLYKGELVAATGDLSIRSYKDKNGQDRTAVSMTVSNIEFLSGNRRSDAGSRASSDDDELPI